MSLTIEAHPGGKSFVVKGDSRAYKDLLMENKGKWNPTLGGYVFSNTHLDDIQYIVGKINSGNVLATNSIPVYSKSTPAVRPTIPTGLGASTLSLPIVAKTKTHTYTVYLPIVDTTANILIQENKLPVKIFYVNPTGDIIRMYKDGDDSQVYEAGIYAGTWQVRGVIENHSIIFN